MKKFIQYLEQLGSFHDCRVVDMNYKPNRIEFSILIQDIYWNFEGLPEYPGPTPGAIIFEGVIDFQIDIKTIEDALKISDFRVSERNGNSYLATIDFQCGSFLKVGFLNATHPELTLRAN